VARQRLLAAPRRQARLKGSSSAKKSSPGVIYKNNFLKKIKIKKLSGRARAGAARLGVAVPGRGEDLYIYTRQRHRTGAADASSQTQRESVKGNEKRSS
jgi:hypothetical protein